MKLISMKVQQSQCVEYDSIIDRLWFDFFSYRIDRSSTLSSEEDAQSDSSVLFSDEEIIGNDSFEYNERLKFKGDYISDNTNHINSIQLGKIERTQ